MPEFELHDHRGKPRRMRDGKPFRYSSRELAKRAKQIFENHKDCATFYRIREVGGAVAGLAGFATGGSIVPPPGGLGGPGFGAPPAAGASAFVVNVMNPQQGQSLERLVDRVRAERFALDVREGRVRHG